jgi:hypothetical protein
VWDILDGSDVFNLGYANFRIPETGGPVNKQFLKLQNLVEGDKWYQQPLSSGLEKFGGYGTNYFEKIGGQTNPVQTDGMSSGLEAVS